MVKIAIGDPGARPPRHRKAIGLVGRRSWLAAAWMLVGMMTDSARAEALRWKFKAGEVLHYSIEQKTVMNVKGMDKETQIEPVADARH